MDEKKKKEGASKGRGNDSPLGKGIRILDPLRGRFCLSIMEPEGQAVRAIFDELDLQGGGHTWERIVRVLVQEHLPDSLDNLDIGAEADNMYVYSADRGLLEALAKIVADAANDAKTIKRIVTDENNDIE